jgi:CRISPR-associated protein Cas1
MRKLLNTLYILSPDRYLSLDGENVVVSQKREQAEEDTRQFASFYQEVNRIPLHNLDSIISFAYLGASPALMGACAKRQINLSFMNPNGKFLARISGELNGNVLLRKEQYRVSLCDEEAIKIARNFIIGKVYNAKWILERAIRDYPLRVDGEKLKQKSTFLSASVQNMRQCNSKDSLRGLEGEAASVYFSAFDDLILQQKGAFFFHGRSKRPPQDNTNAMLSFAYSLLTSMCSSALESVGLDSYVGFFHTDRPGRASLALDLVEEFRGVMADRFVLTLINKQMVDPKGFRKVESGAVLMDDDTRKQFLTHWQNRKKEEIKHPFLDEKVPWGMVPYAQAMLLARYLRGDLDEYPPFLWK